MRKARLLASLSLGMLLAACTPTEAATPAPIAAGTLAHWQTRTPSPTAPPPTALPVKTAVPTATPQLYTVVAGDSFSSIALRFGVSLDMLLAANPDLAPSALSVGEQVRIPQGEADLALFATPTPQGVSLQQAQCYPVAPQGLWCVALYRNESETPLENIAAQFRLVDAAGKEIAAQRGFLILDLLPPQSSLPMAVYFADAPAQAALQVQLLSAMPAGEGYLAVELHNVSREIAWTGKSARVRGSVQLPEGAGEGLHVWVAATAYDAAGRVVGVRRWESAAGERDFDLTVASLGSAIAYVDLAVEGFTFQE